MDDVLIFPINDGRIEIATRLTIDETRQYAKGKGYILDEVRLRALGQGVDPDWKLFDCEVETGP